MEGTNEAGSESKVREGLNRLSKPDHFCYIVRENFIIVKLTYIHHKPDFCHYVPLRLIDRKGNQDI